MGDASTEQGGLHLEMGWLGRGAGDRVAVEDDEVGQHPGASVPRRSSSRGEPGRRRRTSRAAPRSTVSACSGRQAGRSSSVRSTPARDARERVELLDRRVRAVGERRAPASEQRAVGVGAARVPLPDAVGEVAVGGRVAELHGGGDAELGEARQLGGVEQLGVLDALAQPERAPGVARWPRRRRARRGRARRRSRARATGQPAAAARARSRRARSRERDLDARAVEQVRGAAEPSVPSMNTFR